MTARCRPHAGERLRDDRFSGVALEAAATSRDSLPLSQGQFEKDSGFRIPAHLRALALVGEALFADCLRFKLDVANTGISGADALTHRRFHFGRLMLRGFAFWRIRNLALMTRKACS
jgi:hypothetical protein